MNAASDHAIPTMKILLLDTETNGLPKNRYAPPSDYANFPAILQLSWAIYTVAGTSLVEEEVRDLGLALDPSIPWNTGAAAVHGISEVEARHGVPAEEALKQLAVALRSVDMVIAHNLPFDKDVIQAAGWRASVQTSLKELRGIWPPVRELCTMRATTALVKLPATAKQAQYPDLGPYKAPRLNELYTWLYGRVYDVSGAVLHTASSDVHCLAECLRGLVSRKLLAL
jgi:DNA polymerase III epsilon subunit-like protein